MAFVYGSMARGEENAGSDVDLMVIGDVTLDEILTHTTPAERNLGRAINPTVYALKEFRSKLDREPLLELGCSEQERVSDRRRR